MEDLQPAAGATAVRVILPVRELPSVKGRLASALSGQERAQLVLVMLEDVILAGRSAGCIVDVLSPDPEVMSFAEALGANPVCERPRTASLSAALEWAIGTRCSEDGLAMVVLPDVPLVTASELNAVASLALAHQLPCVVAVPDRAGHGTNALACQPPGAIPMCFGLASFRAHREAARSREVQWEARSLPGLALDIDGPADLREFLATPSDTRTYRLLTELGFPARLFARLRPTPIGN